MMKDSRLEHLNEVTAHVEQAKSPILSRHFRVLAKTHRLLIADNAKHADMERTLHDSVTRHAATLAEREREMIEMGREIARLKGTTP